MRLLNLDPRRLPVGRAAAGSSLFLSFEKMEEWMDEGINGAKACGG